VKMVETLHELNPYKPLVTYDNADELEKIRVHCPDAGLVLRLGVSNRDAVVDLSSKFGAAPEEAVDLAVSAFKMGFVVEGLSFHVGSQCTSFDSYREAIAFAARVFEEVEAKGYRIANSRTGRRILDIGGGFPAEEYAPAGTMTFEELAQRIRQEIASRLPSDAEIIAEPGRFLVANACTLVVSVIGRGMRKGTRAYYIDDGIYGSFSGQVFDHQIYTLRSFADGPTEQCIVFGPTCDGFDTVAPSTNDPRFPYAVLPELRIGDLLYAENMGAYTLASATRFNGFPPPRVVHVNR